MKKVISLKKPELMTKKLSKPKRNHNKVLLNSKLSINNLQLNMLGENHSNSLELSLLVYRSVYYITLLLWTISMPMPLAT